MFAAPVLNVLMAVLFAATGVVFVLLFFGPYRNPGWIQLARLRRCRPAVRHHRLVAPREFIREAVRKPYIVYNVVLGSQMLAPDEVDRVRKTGLPGKRRLDQGLRPGELSPSHDRPTATSTGNACSSLPEADQVALGGVIFQYHCNDCHAVAAGLLAGRAAGARLDAGHDPRLVTTWTGPVSPCRPGRARRKKRSC